MTSVDQSMSIGLVLLTYTHDAPAGIERSVHALATGLHRLGHRPVIITATADAATTRGGGDPVRVVGLTTVRLPHPAVEADLLAALAQPSPAVAEVRRLAHTHRLDLVCWCDASWGLGFLAPAPVGTPTALMVRVLRTDTLFHRALARHPDAVLANSVFLVEQATDAGLDTRTWHVVPNAVLTPLAPPERHRREELRRHAPVRVVARAEPQKGIRELIDAAPTGLDRPVEIVLAAAGFEYWPGMQRHVIDECHAAAWRARRRGVEVAIRPALPWQQVPTFLAGASLTIIASTSPETFCNTAAEALSVGTPVVGYDLGHVPRLAGPAGVFPPLPAGPHELWQAVLDLLADPISYHQAAAAAPGRIGPHDPAQAARAFLAAIIATPRGTGR